MAKAKKSEVVDPLMGEQTEPAVNRTVGAEEVEKELVSKPSTAKTPVVPKVVADKSKIYVDTISETREILKNSPHTQFIIPLAEGEKPGAVETVQINGYGLTIQKGAMVNIPMAVAKLLAEKYRIAMTVGADKRIDRASDVSEALS